MDSQHLEDISQKIQDMSKDHHIEILRIIKTTNPSCQISENKNGCFVNMNELDETTIAKISSYVDYNKDQELALDHHENMKNTIIKSLNHNP